MVSDKRKKAAWLGVGTTLAVGIVGAMALFKSK
jgi:hypothetical protein